MKAVQFPEANVQLAENQDEFNTLPILVDNDHGAYVFAFELDDEEKAKLAETGRIWFAVWSGVNPQTGQTRFLPVQPSVYKDHLIATQDVYEEE